MPFVLDDHGELFVGCDRYGKKRPAHDFPPGVAQLFRESLDDPDLDESGLHILCGTCSNTPWPPPRPRRP